jgi:hypothetical protein
MCPLNYPLNYLNYPRVFPCFQDLFDMGTFGEHRKLQLLLVDEAGSIVAESKQLYTPGKAFELLERLPAAR